MNLIDRLQQLIGVKVTGEPLKVVVFYVCDGSLNFEVKKQIK
tara:strand:+ start:108 stop:233 length:126 start_codon:yes stop_codon:yes gene_type:complete